MTSSSRLRRLDFSRSATLPFETVALALVCTADAVSTVYLVHKGLAVEANPLLKWTFAIGPGAFLAAKLASFLPAIAIMEKIRPSRPSLVKWATWTALVAYSAIYVFGSLQLNAAALGLSR